jgi:hypothetical protein
MKFMRILTSHLGVTLKNEPSTPLNIDVFADASFAIHQTDRKSHSGLCIKIGSSTVLCKSESNPLSHTSSTETELVACADAIPYEGVRKLLTELKFPIGSTVIHQDNQSTIRLIVRWIWGEKKNELEEGSEDGREGHTHTHTYCTYDLMESLYQGRRRECFAWRSGSFSSFLIFL